MLQAPTITMWKLTCLALLVTTSQSSASSGIAPAFLLKMRLLGYLRELGEAVQESNLSAVKKRVADLQSLCQENKTDLDYYDTEAEELNGIYDSIQLQQQH